MIAVCSIPMSPASTRTMSAQDALTTIAPIFGGGIQPRRTIIKEQIDNIPLVQTRSLDVEGLPRLEIHKGIYKGSKYVLESWLHSHRPKTSWVNAHGFLLLPVL